MYYNILLYPLSIDTFRSNENVKLTNHPSCNLSMGGMAYCNVMYQLKIRLRNAAHGFRILISQCCSQLLDPPHLCKRRQPLPRSYTPQRAPYFPAGWPRAPLCSAVKRTATMPTSFASQVACRGASGKRVLRGLPSSAAAGKMSELRGETPASKWRAACVTVR